MPNPVESKHRPDMTAIRSAEADAIAEAGALLRAGGLVAMPTETVYGLAADATNGEAVARIFEVKGRPRFNPLIVHAPDVATAALYGEFDDQAAALAKAFWPGPLTLVVPRRANSPIADLVSAGLDTLAVRVPDHSVTQAVLRAAGRPLAAPSANRSGHVSATSAEHVAADLGTRVPMILDAGPTRHGLESTVVSIADDFPALLRPGAISTEAIEAVLQLKLLRRTEGGDAPQSPGQIHSHYAPRAALRLNAIVPEKGEAFLAFGPSEIAIGATTINLSERGDLVEAAAKLFSALRALDASGAACVAVAPIPDHGLGEAINDRLKRAAAPRRR